MTLLSAVAPVEQTPVDRFLDAQADLTAVERFAQRHESELLPRQARYYRDLIPLATPLPGQQYAFDVDLDACTGCKACVAACHTLNGLDDGESWRKVTLFTGATAAQPFQQTVTAACHHCADPACMNGCPVDAYEKDPVTGIVSHLDDQCIGCGYCTLTCPYEVPEFNSARGIVRKCDMCRGRLAEGEAPACVQACPNSAIAITVVETASAASAGCLVPGAPPSSITRPTTVYRTERSYLYEPPVVSSAAGPAQSHPPLAVMLVLTQLSVGAFVIEFLMRQSRWGSAGALDAVVAVGAGMVALGASVFHLGRPRYCYRAVLGFRHSWLSREVVAFGAFTGVATLYATLAWLWPAAPRGVATGLAGFAAVLGLLGVVCSVLIYSTTRRASWRLSIVSVKFGLTTAACGLATVLWASLVSAALHGSEARMASSPVVPVVLAGLVVAKLLAEAAASGRVHDSLRRNLAYRVLAGVVGGVGLPLLLAASGGTPALFRIALATVALGAMLAGEFLERFLFFTTASAPR